MKQLLNICKNVIAPAVLIIAIGSILGFGLYASTASQPAYAAIAATLN